MPREYYKGIKTHVFKENVNNMSINEKVGLNKQNNPNFVFQKIPHIHAYISKHTQRQMERTKSKC